MAVQIETTPEGPICSNCRGSLAEGLQVLVVAELYTQATVDSDGVLSFEDPRGSFDFDWELRDADCPHCGHHLTGSGHVG